MAGSFQVLALTPAGHAHPSLAIAAARCGLVGVLNAEIGMATDALAAALARLEQAARHPYGLKLRRLDGDEAILARRHLTEGKLRWLILDGETSAAADGAALTAFRDAGCRVLLELTSWPDDPQQLPPHDGLVVKGHEAGGRVGEETTFILLQKAVSRQDGPVYARGGLGGNGIAAARAVGAAGVVLDDQLLLLKESPVRLRAERYLKGFSGLETGIVGERWRFLEKPGFTHVKALRPAATTQSAADLDAEVLPRIGWDDPARQLVPVGQAAVFAADFATRHGNLAGLARWLESQSAEQVALAATLRPLAAGHGVAEAHGTHYPIVQGPMTRVSDTAAFAQSVAEAGGLPLLALALMRPDAVEDLLAEVGRRLGDRPWGVGLLGFAPGDLIAGQIEVVRRFNPRFALIAGGRPGQAQAMEADGIAAYLHVPSPGLLKLFLEQGAERFVFEGRECGGHIGPLSSFVLWDLMVSALLEALAGETRPERFQVLFAGGIHDARSAAVVSAMAAPLAARGVKIGVLMGTAYLFTREIVETGSVVPWFQEQALACTRTVSLETGPGHASRCALTPFAEQFLDVKRQLIAAGRSGEDIRLALEDLTLGRLRVATKGIDRVGAEGALAAVPVDRQRATGMYMIGQAATAIDRLSSVADLHHSVSDGAGEVIAAQVQVAEPPASRPALRPADIAVIGLAAIFPKAGDVHQYWENILDQVDAITEIPPERWDWRLYFDGDRHAPDKIYSRWGGFVDDLPFDPMRYGIPPVAMTSIDPLQLMTLAVVERCLLDAGYAGRAFNRERVSVILGASGGAGDVGAQYAVRAEMPRFLGELNAEAAQRLPKWTEDTFAGILLNVAAGRVANRLDFGGVNFTVDAACASSLAAVYQGVLELESGRSDLVVVGGVDTVQGPFGYLCFSKTQALSPNGRSRTFDVGADGIAISEGIAILALKRLADAEHDGDRIYAVIKGIGGSSDGRAKSMTAPHPDGQIRALKRAYEMAGYSPATVGLFEAHGTGTVAGDSAELSALTQLLAEAGAPPRQSAVGSVKTLIGHTKATAGAAGLIKAVLACHHKVLPPHGFIDTPNDMLRDPAVPLYLVEQPRPWLTDDGAPRRASVSAFGFGGTNFHATLEEYDDAFLPAPQPACRDAWRYELLVWRASDRPKLAAAVRAIAAQLTDGATPELRDLAFSLTEALPAEGETAALVVARDEPLGARVAALAAHLEDGGVPLPAGGFYTPAPLLAGDGRIGLVFSGQGTQYPGMLREVMILFPELRNALAQADAVLADRLAAKGAPAGRLSRVIDPVAAYDAPSRAAAAAQLTQTDYAQPALGVIEAGLWAVLQRFGLIPTMACGHSYGEYAALHAAGVFDFEQLLRISEARGAFMVKAAAGGDLGTMAALQCERGAAEAAIAGRPDVCISAHNAPNQTIISGARAAIDAVLPDFEARGISVHRLPVGAAFHSPIIAPASEGFAAYIAEQAFAAPAFAIYSNVTAAPHPQGADEMRALLVRQLLSPVEFVASIEAMYAAGARVFVGVGPKRVHAGLAAQILGARPHRAIALDDEEGGLKGLLEGLGALLAEGARLAVGEAFAGRDCRRLVLDDLGCSPRRPPLSPHHWLLNGTGARRAGEPPHQPLTADAVAARRAVTATQNPVPPVDRSAEQRTGEHRSDGDRTASVRMSATAVPWSQSLGVSMDGTNSGSPPRERLSDGEPFSDSNLVGERLAAFADYQQTMRQFLATQEAVMTAFLSGRGARVSSPEHPIGERMVARPRPMAILPRSAPPLPPAKAALRPAEPAALPQPTAAAAPPPASVAMPPPSSPSPPSAPTTASADRDAPPKGNGAAAADQADTVMTAGHGNGISRDGIAEMLLSLVEERTGYPRDMLGMDQDLEAELGIDSIKRVEIVGALLKALPTDLRGQVADVGDNLNRQKTLSAILDLLWKGVGKANGSAPNPFELTGAGKVATAAYASLPRFTMTAYAQPLPSGARPLPAGAYLLTDDESGVAAALAARIDAEGARAVLVGRAALTDGAALDTALSRFAGAKVAGIIHLAPLAAAPLDLAAPPAAWRSEIARNDEAAFRLVQRFAEELQADGRIILVSGLGGAFARDAAAGTSGITLAGGSVGLAKSLRAEWPQCIVKAVDLDAARSTVENARHVLSELAEPAGRIEVGYPQGIRTIFRTEPAPLPSAEAAPSRLDPGAVILATGGARGITATLLAGIAGEGVTVVLVGRTPLPATEDAYPTAADASDLRRMLLAAARSEERAVTPAEVEAKVRAIRRDREIRGNLRRLAAGGASVDYRAADLRDFGAAGALIDDIYRRYGRLDGIIHGAGIIDDRLLIDKSLASWRAVVATKVEGALALARAVRPDGLRFFVLFSSVAGRYGNAGQTDYATANELLNRLAWQLHRQWQG
ncbi:MAG: SDR family NAD(P)-dependent oxidoreductase, partial [Rhodospirillales bacterium]|nr:SDR family NAD(P)-dependent oxidoreductase [Rhodospirillales bacterium]